MTAPLTQYFVAATLDGFIATEDDDLDWLLSLDGPHAPDGGDRANPYERFIAEVGAIAMGASTYAWVLDHLEGPWPYSAPTWVFTHRDLRSAGGGGEIRFTADPVPAVHGEMVRAAAGRNVWLVGGGELVGAFLDANLLDELWVSVAPVLLGSGKPLLPRRRARPLRLLEAVTSTNGTFVHLRYAVR